MDLVEEEDRITHILSLDDDIQVDDSLLIFRYDPEFEENEKKYTAIRVDILGEVDDGNISRLVSTPQEDQNESEELEAISSPPTVVIRDKTNTNIINLRKAVYLTVMSSLEFEECCHKLLKLSVPGGLEVKKITN